MRLDEISPFNKYFRVLQPLKVWKLMGHQPTNSYYGNARIHAPHYERFELEQDDEIHQLVGGMFFVRLWNDGVEVFEGRISPPSDKHPFEKSYAVHDGRDYTLAKLVSDKIIQPIPVEQSHRGLKYR